MEIIRWIQLDPTAMDLWSPQCAYLHCSFHSILMIHSVLLRQRERISFQKAVLLANNSIEWYRKWSCWVDHNAWSPGSRPPEKHSIMKVNSRQCTPVDIVYFPNGIGVWKLWGCHWLKRIAGDDCSVCDCEWISKFSLKTFRRKVRWCSNRTSMVLDEERPQQMSELHRELHRESHREPHRELQRIKAIDWHPVHSPSRAIEFISTLERSSSEKRFGSAIRVYRAGNNQSSLNLMPRKQ